MAIGTITRFSEGMGADQYDAVMEKLGMADEPVEGLIFHSAGELARIVHEETAPRVFQGAVSSV
jgi:hypothetical protein